MQGINQGRFVKNHWRSPKILSTHQRCLYISLKMPRIRAFNTMANQLPLHFFWKAAVQLKETDLFIEWTYFLKKKSISFPLNILIPLMEWAHNDLNFCQTNCAFLGPLGQQLAAQFPEFHILSERYHENPCNFQNQTRGSLLLKDFGIKPDAAFQLFYANPPGTQRCWKIKYLRICKVRLIQDRWNALQILLNPKKILLHQELMYIKLKTDVSAFNNQQVQFQLLFIGKQFRCLLFKN